MEEVSLRIGDEVFKVNKQLLCEYSDYFRAMFSGYYLESEKQEIIIDMLDPSMMSIILKYMQMGMIILSDYPLATIGEIAIAANFLQITELTKQIQYVLDIQLNESNWIETMEIAQNASYTQLEQYAAAYGLHSFNSIKTEHIPTIHKLVWYLSHPYLDSQNEFCVFKFGFKWLFKNQQLDDILLVLACLDIKSVTNRDMVDIREFLNNYVSHFSDSLFLEIIHCLLDLTSKDIVISEFRLHSYIKDLRKKFSENVLSELLIIIKNSRHRMIKHIPVVPIWILKNRKLELLPHCLYTYEEDKGFEQYLEVAEKNVWGWNCTAWGLTKLVIVCGEHGRGTGSFMRDVRVYDTLKKTWTHFGVQLPSRRHAAVTTVGDLLYIVGGVGEFRVVLETAIVYDLKERSCRSIAKLPDAIQGPAICTHNNKVYTAGHKNIYCHEAYGDRDFWEIAVTTDKRMSFMRSLNNYIYCMQAYFRRLYRFRPGIDKELQPITSFCNLPTAICRLGNSLMVFTMRSEHDEITVEEYKEEFSGKPRVHSKRMENMRVNDVSGCCALVMTMPPLCTELPQYHRERLITNTSSSSSSSTDHQRPIVGQGRREEE